jgi:ferredoxin
MNDRPDAIDEIRAAFEPHGLFVRGLLHFDGDGPDMGRARQAETVVLIGNIGDSFWSAFSAWRAEQAQEESDPLDAWSESLIRPIAKRLRGVAWFPSEKPWQPFQQWAMAAEGLKPSPLGVLIHPQFGLWHGYRGAIGFSEIVGAATASFERHPCDHCPDRPCLDACPAGAIRLDGFALGNCRVHLATPEGQSGCMVSGCLARNACPVGAEHRYCEAQLKFHMAALNLGAR